MKPKPVHLNRYFHFTNAMRALDTVISVDVCRSRFDGHTNRILRMRPAAKRIRHTIIFFHGMDGDCGDAIILRDLAVSGSAEIICLGGRGPAWVSDAILADTAQLIEREVRSKTPLTLMGVSMGASQALAAAGLMPVNLRKKIYGVIALIPSVDLNRTAAVSSHPRVRRTILESALRPRADFLKDRSPLSLIQNYPREMRFALLRRQTDKVLPEKSTRKFTDRLIREGRPVISWSEPGDHEFVHTDFDFDTFFEEYLAL